jgi:uncharacterized protein YoxC
MKIKNIIKMYSPFCLLLISGYLEYFSFTHTVTPTFLAQYGGMAIAILTIYIIGVSSDETDHVDKCDNSFGELTKEVKASDVQTQDTYSLLKKVQEMSIETLKGLERVNQTQTEIITTSARFYTLLAEMRKGAKNRVQLTQLDPNPPVVFGDPVRKDYFDKTIQFIREHPDVKVQRIMSIPNKEKLNWVKEDIEKSKDLNNLHLAYIRITDIESIYPTPPILSMQIVDESKLLLLDLRYSYMPMAFKPCLYLEDRQVVKQIYSQYYDSLWSQLETYNQAWEHGEKNQDKIGGLILKDGMDSEGYMQKLNWISNCFVKASDIPDPSFDIQK